MRNIGIPDEEESNIEAKLGRLLHLYNLFVLFYSRNNGRSEKFEVKEVLNKKLYLLCPMSVICIKY